MRSATSKKVFLSSARGKFLRENSAMEENFPACKKVIFHMRERERQDKEH